MKHCLLCEVVMNFWLFFLLRHFHGRSNLPILTANLLRRTGGGVLGVEFALATELSTSVEFINAGVRLVGTVFPPFMTMVISLRPGSLFERSRELFKLPEGEVLPSSLTSILRLHEWRWYGFQSYAVNKDLWRLTVVSSSRPLVGRPSCFSEGKNILIKLSAK